MHAFFLTFHLYHKPRAKKFTNPKFKEEEDNLRKKFTEQVKQEENRFRHWEQQLIAERDRLNKDLEDKHAQIKNLEGELDALYQGQGRNTTRR